MVKHLKSVLINALPVDIIENYEHVCKKYVNIWDYMYEEYLSKIDQ